MLVEILRPVLVGQRIASKGEQLEVPQETGRLLISCHPPVVKLLHDEQMPMLTRQSLQGQPFQPPQPENPQPTGEPSKPEPTREENPPASETAPVQAGLSLEQLVAMGIQPKVARKIIEAGISTREELTAERLTAIEGIGETTAEQVLQTITPKPQG